MRRSSRAGSAERSSRTKGRLPSRSKRSAERMAWVVSRQRSHSRRAHSSGVKEAGSKRSRASIRTKGTVLLCFCVSPVAETMGGRSVLPDSGVSERRAAMMRERPQEGSAGQALAESFDQAQGVLLGLMGQVQIDHGGV